MDVEALRSFVMVARTGNVTRAAEELYVTQPTLSRRITALESELNTQLFERSHEGVALTDAGRILLREAEGIVARADALPQLLANTEEEQDASQPVMLESLRGSLNIISQNMLDDGLVSAFIARLIARHPLLDIRIQRAIPPEIRQALDHKTADVGFLLRPLGSSISQLLTRKVGESRVQLLVYDEHPFASRSSVDIHELAGQDMILLERRISPEIVDFISSRCFDAGFSLHAVRYVQGVESGVVLVSAGRGLTFVHSMMTFTQPLESVGVRVIDITGVDMTIDYVARLSTGLSDDLRDAVLDAINELGEA